MTGILDPLASGRLMGVTFAVLLVLQIVVAVGIPERLAAAFGYAGGLRMFALDMPIHPAYGDALAQYGPQGRQEVVRAHLVWDIVVPVTYVLFFLSAFGLLARGDPLHRGLWTLAGGVAVIGGLADLIENAGIIILCKANSSRAWLGPATATATTLKWICLFLAVGALLFGAGSSIAARA